VAAALSAQGKAGGGLAKAHHRVHAGALQIAVPAGRALAEAQKIAKLDAVLSAVALNYPANTTLEVVPMSGTGTARDQSEQLKRATAKDPDMQRVLKALSAELDTVSPLTEGEL